MATYQFRPVAVEAMFFDGTPVGAQAVIEWLSQIAPELTVRQRVEYRGWSDSIGHIELEIRDHDDQSTSGDWIVVDIADDPARVQLFDSETFHRRFELGPD